MSNTWFRFKQFCIHHERCAMKVGTDGVLLGAWAPLRDESMVLDIGTGSGLIALMLAQRFPSSHVLGIDINADAISQAQENVSASPFADRVDIRLTPLQGLDAAATFDAIVCNPPFFEESLLPPDTLRATARHATSLTLEDLVHYSSSHLCLGGRFCIILPTTSFERFRQLCFAKQLNLEVRCDVLTTPLKAPKRTLACFCKEVPVTGREEQLVLTENGHRSSSYAALTHDFYLY